jgi:hypothetical protein
LQVDAAEAIGAEKLEWRVIDAGHELPMTHAEEVVREISGVWGI